MRAVEKFDYSRGYQSIRMPHFDLSDDEAPTAYNIREGMFFLVIRQRSHWRLLSMCHNVSSCTQDGNMWTVSALHRNRLEE